MRDKVSTDYETYREIMSDLLNKISGHDLDAITLKRLYESKLVYLENLRVKCFRELNKPSAEGTHFTADDHALIISAMKQTRSHLRELFMLSINERLARRKVS